MKKFLPLILLLALNPMKANAACSGGDCCAINSGVITLPAGGNCAILPDQYGVTVYEKYLCTSEPTAPTASSNADLSMCVQTCLLYTSPSPRDS